MTFRGYLQTGQVTCHDTFGREISCNGSGQDAAFRRGIPWPVPRFELKGNVVADELTGLIWTRNANLAEFPLTWQESLDYVRNMNQKNAFGYSDWRLPTVKELASLADLSRYSRIPELLENTTKSSFYWASTTYTNYTISAWYIQFDNGFDNGCTKSDRFYVRAVRTEQ